MRSPACQARQRGVLRQREVPAAGTWNREDPNSLAPLLTSLNRIRNTYSALQTNETLRFHPVDNEHLIAYSKRSAEDHTVLTVVNLDPATPQTGWTELDLLELGVPFTGAFEVEDLLTGARVSVERNAQLRRARSGKESCTHPPYPPHASVGKHSRGEYGRLSTVTARPATRQTSQPAQKKRASASDPQWYKDAIIYELHVKAFADGNNDGIGDFVGLLEKLPYLQKLGVTCLWILPFFPSPGRDDGYDIADYLNVNPAYGTIDDFKRVPGRGTRAGHAGADRTGYQSHQRPAPVVPGSAQCAQGFTRARHVRVERYGQTCIAAFASSLRTRKRATGRGTRSLQQYYWHRFFSHQPDLNFDNPRVMEEVLNAMRFWMDMGVDGLRLDAIPYLVERDGTSCENVPETHVKIKEIRAAIDAEYENRLVLAEANMWPQDVLPYFGDGDECHMAFHFPR